MTKSPKKVDPTKETTVDGDGGSREQGSYIHLHDIAQYYTIICGYTKFMPNFYTLYTANIETAAMKEAAEDEDFSPGATSSPSTRSFDVPLPSPIHGSGTPKANHSQNESVDTLTLELEVQDLLDRVCTLEAGHAQILEAQKSILKMQERIL